jgi:hypothetical protein
LKRCVFLDDYAYALSANALHVQDTRARGNDVDIVQLTHATSSK